MGLANGVVQNKLLETIELVGLANNKSLIVAFYSHLNLFHSHVALTHGVVDLGDFLVLRRFNHVEVLDGRMTGFDGL